MVRVYEQVDVAAIDGSFEACVTRSAADEALNFYDREVQESGTIGSGTNLVGSNDNIFHNRAMHLESEANQPNSTSWPAGDWVFRFNVTTGNANVLWFTSHVCRVDSSGVSQASIGQETGSSQALTSGVKTVTVSGSADAGAAATDRFYLIGTVIRAGGSHGNQNATITNDQLIDTPFAALTATAVRDPVMGQGIVPFAR